MSFFEINFQIEILIDKYKKKECYAQVIDFTKYFVLTQPLFSHVAATKQQFVSSYGDIIAQCCNSNLSFGFLKGHEIVSAVLAVDYVTNQEPIEFVPLFTSIEALVQEAQQGYKPKNKEKTISAFIVLTHPMHTGKGLCYKLLLHLEKQAKTKRFQQIQADCINPLSEKVFLKTGYAVAGRIDYKTFKFEDQIPFKQVKGSDGLSVVVKHI